MNGTTRNDNQPLFEPAQTASMIIQASIKKPVRVHTRASLFGGILNGVAPPIKQIVTPPFSRMFRGTATASSKKPATPTSTLSTLSTLSTMAMALPLALISIPSIALGAGIAVPQVQWHAAAPAANRAVQDVPAVVAIAAGGFVQGSARSEREMAYRLDEKAYGKATTREQAWYENEITRHRSSTGAYAITRTPITQRQYAAFVAATGHRAPGMSRELWQSYGLQHPFERTQRFIWPGGHPATERLDHPVVLVSQGDARAYALWLSRRTGWRWRLPTETEWEKAARGNDGRAFPWGDEFDPARLNSHDGGPFDTEPVGRRACGASPFGVLDAAGQVFEWTSTPAPPGRTIVKGGSWDDKGCGVCRPAARHGRPFGIKHILIGFRLVREAGS